MSPTVRIVLIGTGVIVFFASILSTYYYGKSQYGNLLRLEQRDGLDLKQRHDRLRERHEGVQNSLAQFERQLQVDKSAYEELSKELELSNRQLSDLRSELKFYRSIISPEGSPRGARVQDFKIYPGKDVSRFVFKLVLIQPMQDSKELSGKLGFEIRGTQGEETAVIKNPMPDVARVPVRFKFFQNVNGEFVLPAGFAPSEVRVNLKVGKKNVLDQKKWWQWSEVTVATLNQ